jgi:glycosyltransferase involved in cell wall biosynthesis
MAPWCFNECLRKGLVRGDLVMYLCDDDILYPCAFEAFVCYCRRNPEARAMYASQDVAVIYPNGWRAIAGERRATAPGGRSCGGRPMDGQVDYLQFCHRTDVLDLFPDDEYWPEDKETENHADGIFMERVGQHVPIHPIDVKVSQNRRTAQSTNIPIRSFSLVDCMANGVPILASRSIEIAEVEEHLQGRLPTPTRSASEEATRSVSEEATSPRLRFGLVWECDAKVSQPSGGEVSISEEAPLVTVSIRSHNQGTFLPAALASVAAQTYPHLEVLVIDDGSTEVGSVEVFAGVEASYPQFRFLRQAPAGTARTRNRGLREARGVYFLPMDADQLAHPETVERLVARVRQNPRLSAVTCYLAAFKDASDLALASVKNVHGNGLFRTADFRAVGGYEAEPDREGDDWSGFIRLVNAGYLVDILPEHLFSYQDAEVILSRSPERSGSVGRGLHRFRDMDRVLAEERVALWTALAGYQRRLEHLAEQNRALQERLGSLRYRIADRVHALLARAPAAKRGLKRLLLASRDAWEALARTARRSIRSPRKG